MYHNEKAMVGCALLLYNEYRSSTKYTLADWAQFVEGKVVGEAYLAMLRLANKSKNVNTNLNLHM